ncbi:hypothetical protein NLX65_03830 [Candidatus Cardinium sp. TP]|nr:hypothetical protein [Candidatus Cardinium sp. TP]
MIGLNLGYINNLSGMNKILQNYFYKVSVLFAAILCINFTNRIVYCALLFTFLTLILNGIAKYHGSKKATLSIVLCTATTLGLLYNKQYYMAGKPISGLIVASLCAILIASYIGLRLFIKLELRYGFALSNSISLAISALVDHLLMGLFFIRIWRMHKVWSVVYKETAYTYLFAVCIYLVSVAILYAKPVYSKTKQRLRWFSCSR